MNTNSSSLNGHYSNDVLTQALGLNEHDGRVRGVGGYVTPTIYFHSVKKISKHEGDILLENKEFQRQVSELKAQIHSNLSTPLSAHESCSKLNILEGIESKKLMKEKSKLKVEEKSKRIEMESMDKPKENEMEGKEMEQINMNVNETEFNLFKVRNPLLNRNV